MTSFELDFVKVLDLTSVKKLATDGLLSLIPTLKHLHTLYLSDTFGVNDQVIDCISEYCPELARLYLSRSGLISDQSLVKIAERCLTLEVL